MATPMVKIDKRSADYLAGYDVGYRRGTEDADDGADDSLDDLQYAIDNDGLAAVVDDAHRQAGHSGPWNVCGDPICAAIERWLHFEGVLTH